MFRGPWILVQTHKEDGLFYLGKTTKSCVCELTGFHGRSSEGTVCEAKKSLNLLSINPIWKWRQYQYQRGTEKQGSIVSLFFDFSCPTGPFVNNVTHYFSHWGEMFFQVLLFPRSVDSKTLRRASPVVFGHNHCLRPWGSHETPCDEEMLCWSWSGKQRCWLSQIQQSLHTVKCPSSSVLSASLHSLSSSGTQRASAKLPSGESSHRLRKFTKAVGWFISISLRITPEYALLKHCKSQGGCKEYLYDLRKHLSQCCAGI